MKHSVVGMDIAKKVFQLHTVDPLSGKIERIKLRREDVLAFFAQRQSCLVAIEACGSAHWWARQLRQHGHEVRLLAPRSVRPFVLRNKTDAADAQAIWTAVQQPGACRVAIKQADQQAILSLHRIRAQLLKFRIMQSNGLRGLFYEFGIVLPEGYAPLSKAMPEAFAEAENQVPPVLLESLREQWARVLRLEEEIRVIELRLKRCLRENPDCRKIAEIPGIGLLTATAAVASLGDATTFRSGRTVRRLAGTGSPADRYRRSSPTTGAEQARRQLPAHAVDAWRPLDPRQEPEIRVALALAGQAALQRGGRRGGQQAGQNPVGRAGQGLSVPGRALYRMPCRALRNGNQQASQGAQAVST